MRQVKDVRTSRLLVAYTFAPPLYLSAERGRRLFEGLLGSFPELVGTPPLIIEDQQALFLRAAPPGRPPEPLCQLVNDSIQVSLQNPDPNQVMEFAPLLKRVYELLRDIYQVQRVCRAGRVHNKGYVMADGKEDARAMVRDLLTKLAAEQAAAVQLQFSRRDGPYNVNLSIVPASTSVSNVGDELPLHDVILTGSDVNNWDVSGDVLWHQVEEILARGERHADEEVPQFLRDQLGVDAQS